MEGLANTLQEQQNKLMEREAELEKQQPLDEKAMQLLELEKQKNARATLELKKAVERVMKLDKRHKIEKEEFRKQSIKLENKIDAKHALEWEIQRLGGQMQGMKRTRVDINEEELKLEELEAMKKTQK